MNLGSALLWGFVGTLLQTTIESAAQGLGLTRMSLPFMVGTALTPNRNRARWLGALVHLLNGWGFAFVYAAIFESWRRVSWWRGALLGLIHAGVVLVAGMDVLPAVHPRMADEEHGPEPTRELEPPGFLALNYGERTPLTLVLAHLVYGLILGSFYQLRK
jgi:hypothetical protein